MKNDKKNRRNRISMTQNYNNNQIDSKNENKCYDSRNIMIMMIMMIMIMMMMIILYK